MVSTGTQQYEKAWDLEHFWGYCLPKHHARVLEHLANTRLMAAMVFTVIEMITGKKPSIKVLEIAQMIGFFLLLALLIFANGNDVVGIIWINEQKSGHIRASWKGQDPEIPVLSLHDMGILRGVDVDDNDARFKDAMEAFKALIDARKRTHVSFIKSPSVPPMWAVRRWTAWNRISGAMYVRGSPS